MNFTQVFLIHLILLGSPAITLKSQAADETTKSAPSDISKMQNGDLIRISSKYVNDFAGAVSEHIYEIQKNESSFVFLQHSPKIFGKKGASEPAHITKLTKAQLRELEKVFEGYRELPVERRSMSFSAVNAEHIRGKKRIGQQSFLLPQGWEKKDPKFVSFHLFAESLKKTKKTK